MTLRPKIGDIIEIEQGDSCFEVRVMGITKDGYLCEQDNIQGAILLEGTGLDEADATDIEDFLRSGGRVERIPYKNTRKEKGAAFRFGSKHIGAAGGSGKGKQVSGLGAATSVKGNKPVVTAGYDPELDEEKVRLDPKCWKGKKIGNPKTKMKGGVHVNNCVPEGQEDIEESGLQYYTGVKKHGEKYMRLAAKAGREGASQEELGRLKDRYSKAEKTDEGRFGRDRNPFYGGDEFRNRERNVGVENERNNYQVVVNGKLWKVFADRQQAMNIARSLKMKGKDVEVFPTGAPPSQSMSEMEGHKKTFTVVYYSPKTDRNVSKMIRAKNESDIWDQFKVKGIDVVSVKEQGVAEAGIDPTLGPRGRDRDMRRIDPGPEEKYYFQVPFELKTLAKDMGLRWDADKKKWFTTSILTKTQAERKFKPWKGVAEGSLNELSTATLKSYRKKASDEVNAIKQKQELSQLSDKDFFKKQDRLMGITGASKRIDKRGITGVGEDSLHELFEPQTDYYQLANNKIIQATYRPLPNQNALPGTVKISYVNPALMPKGSSFDSTGSIYRWDKAPDGVKQAIEKFVGQANGVSHVTEAEYQGRKVPLGKKMAGDVKKSKVYVRKPNGKVVKVNFGDKNMTIKKSNPARRKSFRARHNCDNPGPRWKARYWSCRSW